MSFPRIYQNTSLSISQDLQVDERAHHYLMNVLRIKLHDKIIIFNGQGGEFLAAIKQISKKNILVSIIEFNPKEAESPLEIYLAQGVSRGEKMDFVIQKAVELGVKKIIPLFTEYGNVKLDLMRQQKKLDHWQGIIVSACEQSGRNTLPELTSPKKFLDWIKIPQNRPTFILSPHSNDKISRHLTACQKVTLLIGPEGGLSPSEEKLAISQGFTPLNLGPRILRTETATLAGISTFQVLLGDMAKNS